MDVIKAIQNYVNKIVNDVSGMKVLLLDAETVTLLPFVLIRTAMNVRVAESSLIAHRRQ